MIVSSRKFIKSNNKLPIKNHSFIQNNDRKQSLTDELNKTEENNILPDLSSSEKMVTKKSQKLSKFSNRKK